MNASRFAKLSAPDLFDVAPRERLFGALDKALRHPALWLSGMAGAGKTTLVAGYLGERQRPACWLHVDSGDRDPAELFRYLSALGGQAAGEPGWPSYSPNHADQLPLFARRFFRAFFDAQVSGTVVVMDNVQAAMDADAFTDIILSAVEETPAHCRLLLISRTAPPAQCARAIAGNRLVVLGGATLRLTPEEVEAIAGLDPGETSLADSLLKGCDGWAAGLSLILAQQALVPNPTDAIRHSEGVMFDFLAAEVFERADTRLQHVLLHVWPLPRVDAQAAERLSGEPAAAPMLDELYRSNFFTECHFDATPSYRLHDLFRSYLGAEARRRLSASQFDGLMRTAADYLEQSGELAAAADLLEAAGASGALAEVALRAAPGLMESGRVETLSDWLSRLPPDQITGSPRLGYWLGRTLLARSPADARAAFARAYGAHDASAGPLLAAQLAVGVIDSYFVEWSEFVSMDPWLDRLDAAMPAALDRASPSQAIELMSSALVGGLYRRPNDPALRQRAEWVQEHLDDCPSLDQRVLAGTFVLNFWNWTGDTTPARTLIARLTSIVDDPRVSPFRRAWYWLRCAYHHYVASQFDAQDRALERVREIASVEHFAVIETIATLYTAFGQLAVGALDDAETTLASLEEVINPGRRLDRAIERYLQGWLHLARGESAAAAALADEAVRLAEEAGVGNVETYFRLLAVMAQNHCGDSEAAWHAGERLRMGAAEGNYPLLAFESTLVSAYLAECSGRTDDADRLACEALGIGARHTFSNALLWLPGMVSRVIARALALEAETAFGRRVIEQRQLAPPPLAPPQWPWRVSVRCFGQLQIERDGVPVRFQGKAQKRPLSLLMALVAAGGKGVASAALAAQLWPDADGDAARAALTTTVFRLRRLLGDVDVLIQSEGKLALNAHLAWLDVWHFEAICGAVAAGHGMDAVGQARRLLDCYRGHYLADEEEAPWMLPARQRLEAMFLRAIETLGGHMAQKGDLAAAVDLYGAGVGLSPLAETLYRKRMQLLDTLGRRAEAIEDYRRCRHMLSVVLGVQPAAETEALRRRLE
ncbi:MAG: hypothetical protein KDG55_00745 [Rhodocyclaceae bacterium]|nr:hypothetical protein [Rhodocyclaceae bacterium]